MLRLYVEGPTCDLYIQFFLLHSFQLINPSIIARLSVVYMAIHMLESQEVVIWNIVGSIVDWDGSGFC